MIIVDKFFRLIIDDNEVGKGLKADPSSNGTLLNKILEWTKFLNHELSYPKLNPRTIAWGKNRSNY